MGFFVNWVRKGCLTIYAALGPIFWTGLNTTPFLLEKDNNIRSCCQQSTFVHFTVMKIKWERVCSMHVLEEAAQSGKQIKGAEWQ